MIRLFSIEDHWLITDGLHSRFRSDRDNIMVSCSAESMKETADITADMFDIILLDLLIPGTDPVENVQKLKKKFPGKPIVILTTEESSVWKDQMCEAGVQAYLTKHDERKTIKDVIKRVALGEDLFKERRIELNNKPVEGKSKKDDFFLKPEEKEILSWFLQELNLKEISAKKITSGSGKKMVSESTIAKVMAKLRKQFKVKTNTSLLRIILEKKLINAPPLKPEN
jgi:two-component system, NarL family, invasion response regulator UvrY